MKYLIIFLVFIGNSFAFAKKSPFRSPKKPIEYFLKYTEGDDYNPQKASLSFVANKDLDNTKKVVQLKQVLKGNGIFLHPSQIHNNEHFIDSNSFENIYILNKAFPEIYLEKSNDEWKFPIRTAQAIGVLHQKTYPLGTAYLLNKLSGFGTTKFLGLYIWQLIGIFSLILVCFVIHIYYMENFTLI